MLRSCSKCGRVHDTSYKCRSQTLVQTKEQALRAKYKWTKKSEDIRERSHYLCAICKEIGDYKAKDVEVHHIVKLRDDPNLFLEDSNLICLCVDHHKKADNGLIDVSYLRNLAAKRDGL